MTPKTKESSGVTFVGSPAAQSQDFGKNTADNPHIKRYPEKIARIERGRFALESFISVCLGYKTYDYTLMIATRKRGAVLRAPNRSSEDV